MSRTVTIAYILELSPAERIQLVEDIWDSIASVPDAVALTEAQRQELDRRLEAAKADPTAGASWADVVARIRSAKP